MNFLTGAVKNFRAGCEPRGRRSTPLLLPLACIMGHGTSESIYSRIRTKARRVSQAALPRMHLVFNAFRLITFVALLAWSLIVLGLTTHFLVVLVSSELTHFVPFGIAASTLTIATMLGLLFLSNFWKTNPVSTRGELGCIGVLGTLWLALGTFMLTASSQSAEVECFSDDDGALEVTSFNTDTYQAQYRVIEAFSIFNAILTWGYFILLLFLALRHHYLGWKQVWLTSATTSPANRSSSRKATKRSGSLPVPVTTRRGEKNPPARHHASQRDERERPRHERDDAARRPHPDAKRPHPPTKSKSYHARPAHHSARVPEVTPPAEAHPRPKRRLTEPPPRHK